MSPNEGVNNNSVVEDSSIHVVEEIVESLVTAAVAIDALVPCGKITLVPTDECCGDTSLSSTISSELENTVIEFQERLFDSSLHSITSISSSSTSDQSTQTDNFNSSSTFTSQNNLLLAALPSDLIQQVHEEAPWLLKAFDGLENRFNNINSKLSDNLTNIAENRDRIAKTDQYLRLNSLLLHRLRDIPFKKKGANFSRYVAKKLNALFPSLRWMGRKVNHNDIDASHPLQSRQDPKKKLVIVKFKVRDLRNKIFYLKKFLKNTSVGISEHLSTETMHLLKKVKETFIGEKVWTEQCQIYVAWGKSKKCIPNEKVLEDLSLKYNSETVPKTLYSHRESSPVFRGGNWSKKKNRSGSMTSISTISNESVLHDSQSDATSLTLPTSNEQDNINVSKHVDHYEQQRQHFANIFQVLDKWGNRKNPMNNKKKHTKGKYNPGWRNGHNTGTSNKKDINQNSGDHTRGRAPFRRGTPTLRGRGQFNFNFNGPARGRMEPSRWGRNEHFVGPPRDWGRFPGHPRPEQRDHLYVPPGRGGILHYGAERWIEGQMESNREMRYHYNPHYRNNFIS